MLSTAVGHQVQEYRVSHGLTQEAFARHVRAYGLNWTASRVSELEAGALPLNLVTLLVLAAALNSIGTVSLASVESLAGDERIPITNRWSTSAESIRGLLLGGESLLATEIPDLEPDSRRDKYDVAVQFINAMPPGMSLRDAAALEREPSLAERRAGKRLGVDPQIVILWADSLWGQGLDEKAATVAKSATAQARGHATRALVQQLDEAIASKARRISDG